MAKFCGNCGAGLNGHEKVCGQCGMPVNGFIPEKKNGGPKSKKKIKKRVGLVIFLVIIAFVVYLAVNLILSHTGHRGLLRKVVNAYESYDIDTLVSFSSDVYYYSDETYVESYFSDSVGTVLDMIEDSLGQSYDISYVVNDVSEASGRTYNKITESLSTSYPDFDTDIISNIVLYDITITAEDGDNICNIDMELTFTKEDGTWRILYLD